MGNWRTVTYAQQLAKRHGSNLIHRGDHDKVCRPARPLAWLRAPRLALSNERVRPDKSLLKNPYASQIKLGKPVKQKNPAFPAVFWNVFRILLMQKIPVIPIS
jgi:hypothetical protein